MKRAICCGFAVALVTGCGPTGSRRVEVPTPDDQLLVIDDVPVPQGSLGSALAGMAPRDVGRIDVLKDAAATSVYGSRGANGVIIITTKRATWPNP